MDSIVIVIVNFALPNWRNVKLHQATPINVIDMLSIIIWKYTLCCDVIKPNSTELRCAAVSVLDVGVYGVLCACVLFVWTYKYCDFGWNAIECASM